MPRSALDSAWVVDELLLPFLRGACDPLRLAGVSTRWRAGVLRRGARHFPALYPQVADGAAVGSRHVLLSELRVAGLGLPPVPVGFAPRPVVPSIAAAPPGAAGVELTLVSADGQRRTVEGPAWLPLAHDDHPNLSLGVSGLAPVTVAGRVVTFAYFGPRASYPRKWLTLEFPGAHHPVRALALFSGERVVATLVLFEDGACRVDEVTHADDDCVALADDPVTVATLRGNTLARFAPGCAAVLDASADGTRVAGLVAVNERTGRAQVRVPCAPDTHPLTFASALHAPVWPSPQGVHGAPGDGLPPPSSPGTTAWWPERLAVPEILFA